MKLYKYAANYLHKMQLTRTQKTELKDSSPSPIPSLKRSQNAY